MLTFTPSAMASLQIILRMMRLISFSLHQAESGQSKGFDPFMAVGFEQTYGLCHLLTHLYPASSV